MRTLMGVALYLWVAAGAVQAEAPTELLFTSDFDLGALEDPTKERIQDPRFLRDWEQQFPSSRFPQFMAVSLVRGPNEERRHLEVPYYGARALVSTRKEFSLVDEQLLRFKARVRWDEIGAGWFEFRLAPDGGGEPLVLLKRQGEQLHWKEISLDVVIPEGFGAAHLEVLLRAEPGRRGGALAIESVSMETVPRIVWGFDSALRKVNHRDEYPLSVSSVSYPSDTYELTFTVEDHNGEERFRETKILLVSDRYPIAYSPRLGRAKSGLARGIYEVTLKLEAKSGWTIVDRRKIALSGHPPFVRRPGGVAWGFDFERQRVAPEWLPEVPPQRVVLHFTGDEQLELPEWLTQYPTCEVTGLLDEGSGWTVERADRLGSILTRVQNWVWRGDASLGEAFLAKLDQGAPFLRTGFDLDSVTALPSTGDLLIRVPADLTLSQLRTFGVDGRTWSARVDLSGIDEDLQAVRLSQQLFFLAAREPQATILSHPDTTLVEGTEAGGAVARETLLVWDFATSFLSGAKFMGAEDWHPKAHCLVFRRGDEDYVVVAADVRVEGLRVPSTERAIVYDRTGTSRPLELDESGLVTLPVGPDPVVIAGLDLPAVRTARSIQAAGTEEEGAGTRIVTLSATNHFAEPVRIALQLNPPSNWETADALTPQTIESGQSAQWPLTVRVPDWYGLGGPTVLEGVATLELDSGREVKLPLKIPVPMESKLVAIEAVRLESEQAEVTVLNRSDEELRLNVHLQARPGDEEKTTVDVVLPAGDRQSFKLAYSRPSEQATVAELWVGVTVPEKKAYVNRVYALPRK